MQQALLRLLEGTVVQVANKAGAASGERRKEASDSGAGSATETTEEGGGGLGAWYNHRKAKTPASQPASFNVDTSSILFVLSGAFVGVEDVIRKRLTPSSPPAGEGDGRKPTFSPASNRPTSRNTA